MAGRPRIGENRLSSKERKKRFDERMRNAHGQVPDQPTRTPVVVYLSDAARNALKQQRALAAMTDLPALTDSVVIESALKERAGSAVELDADRAARLVEHVRWLESQLAHFKLLYAHRGNDVANLRVRKRWFQDLVRERFEVPSKSDLPARVVAERCREAIQAASGYEVRRLVVELAAIDRQKLEFEDYEKALANRLCAYMDLVLGV